MTRCASAVGHQMAARPDHPVRNAGSHVEPRDWEQNTGFEPAILCLGDLPPQAGEIGLSAASRIRAIGNLPLCRWYECRG